MLWSREESNCQNFQLGTGHKLAGRGGGGFKRNVGNNVTIPDNEHEIVWPSLWP